MSRAFRVGLFIVATLLVLAAGVFLVGSQRFLFRSTYTLKAQFQSVAGLNGGAEVRVGGIHEGTVKTIQLPTQPGGKVTVVMDMMTATRDVVKKDSVASIETEGLLGDKYVEVSFGSPDAVKINNGDTIGSKPPIEISDMIKKTDQILDTAQQAMKNVDAATGNIQAISAKINQGKGTVGALVNDRRIYERVDAATAQAEAGATAFHENMEALKHNFFLRGFFKKRGYEDAGDLGKHEIPRLPSEPYEKKFVYDAGKIFGKPDGAKLKDHKRLDGAGNFLEKNDFSLAVIAAHTGMKGDTQKDQVLTEAQAMVVRKYLVDNFKLDDTRIKTMGLGKSLQASASGKVEIIVYPESPASDRNGAAAHSGSAPQDR